MFLSENHLRSETGLVGWLFLSRGLCYTFYMATILFNCFQSGLFLIAQFSRFPICLAAVSPKSDLETVQ